MATFKIEVILSRFMTNEFKPADPGTKKNKFNMCTCVCRSLRFQAYLSICNPLVLRLIQCKWNFLAVLYRTQVSVDELRFVDKRQFTVIYSTSYTFPYIILIAVGYFMMVERHVLWDG